MFKNTKAFTGFSVNDIAAAKEFYGNTLGIDVKEIPQGLELHIAGGNHIFLYPKSNHTPATYTTLNFMVENIDETMDEMLQKGITFEKYEGMHQDEKGIARGLAAKQGPDIAWFKDPAGNILAILQDK